MPELDSLHADETLPERMQRHALNRLIMLSDGVFAIAITLGALEVRLPERASLAAGTLIHALQGPVVAYAISFAVISAYWLAHRRIFGMLRRVDTVFAILNLLLLGIVALQPAGVQLLIRFGPRGGALEIYFGLIVALGVVQATLWGYAAFVAKLIDPQVSRRYRVSQLIVALVLPIFASGLALYSSRTGSRTLILAAAVVIVMVSVLRHRLTSKITG